MNVELDMYWIAVNEKTPRKGIEVLVLLQTGQIRTAIADKEYAGGFRYAVASRSAWFCTGNVTHWMKKPKLPNAELSGATLAERPARTTG